ncbi:MAG: 50S ribosomal protein L13 [Candidatus Shapirobacteria bacterium]|jgi:large subunit ribosomal protein L13|nr:50S ribosomal protein L13 [Candidatus Shapirobacteria bacterium]
MKTTVLKGNSVERKWHLIDLKGKTLGRACTEIAQLLMGKGKVDFSYHRDDGDYVVAINAADIITTGRKLKQKIYYRHTAWSGHLKELTLGELMRKDPRQVIAHGVHGMVAKNKLRDIRMTRLKVFVGADHKFAEKFTK